MTLTCPQTLFRPAGGTAGSPWEGAVVGLRSASCNFCLLAKVQLFLPAKPLTSTLTPSIIASCWAARQPLLEGERWRIGVCRELQCREDSSVAEVGYGPG